MMSDIWDAITQPLEDLAAFWDEAWGNLVNVWDEVIVPAIDRLVTKFVEMKDNLITAYIEFRDQALEKLRIFFAETLPEAWQTFKDKVAEVWGWIETNFIEPLRNFINTELTDLKEMFDTALTNAINTFKVNVLDPLVAGFDALKDAASKLWDKIVKVKDTLLLFPWKLLQLLSGGSPSPLSIGVDYAAKSFEKLAKVSLPQVNKQLVMMQSAGLSSAPLVNAPAVMGGSSSSQSVSVQMGGVNITSGMDEALFEARVLNIVQKGLRS
jgi:hypothetical protein